MIQRSINFIANFQQRVKRLLKFKNFLDRIRLLHMDQYQMRPVRTRRSAKQLFVEHYIVKVQKY